MGEMGENGGNMGEMENMYGETRAPCAPCDCSPGTLIESLVEYRRASFHTHMSRLRLQ